MVCLFIIGMHGDIK